MAKTQRSLFETGEATARPDAGLLLVSRPDRPLTAAQREFNKLVIKVEELRERLRKEARRFDDDGHHEHAHTLPVDLDGDGRIGDLIVYGRWVSATLHSGRFVRCDARAPREASETSKLQWPARVRSISSGGCRRRFTITSNSCGARLKARGCGRV